MLPIEICYLPAHVQTHFFFFSFFLQKVHFPVVMYNFPLKMLTTMNICTVSQLKRITESFSYYEERCKYIDKSKMIIFTFHTV